MCLLDAAREAGLIESLAKRTAVEVAKFVALFDRMHLSGDETVEEVLGVVLHHTEYRDWLAASETEEDQQRVDNFDELLTDAREFDEGACRATAGWRRFSNRRRSCRTSTTGMSRSIASR